MPRTRTAMRKVKEVLRLRYDLAMSYSQIRRSCGLSNGTLNGLLARAEKAGLTHWEQVRDLSEEALERRLFQRADDGQWLEERPLPDWAEVERDLRRHKHLTLKLVWGEYIKASPGGYGFSQFCDYFRRWRREQGRGVTLRQEHRPGEALQVDYAGDTVVVMDGGQAREAQVFVACLPFSGLIYTEATWTQQLEDWLASHVRAFSFLGGVPGALVSNYVPRHIIRHDEPGHAAEQGEHAPVRADPVRQALRPARLGVGVVGGAEHGDEQLRLAHDAADWIDDRQLLAGVIDEHLVAGDKVLAHGGRQPALELAVEFAEAAVAVSVDMVLSVFLPQQAERDAGTAHLAHQRAPVGLAAPTHPRLDAGTHEQPLLQLGIGDVVWQGPGEPGGGQPLQVFVQRAAGDADLLSDRPIAHGSARAQPHQFADSPHGQPLRWHPTPPRRHDGGRMRRGR